MDTELLVDNRIDDGAKLLAELVRSGFDVTVAAWVRTREEGLWFLYIGSNSASPENVADAYRTVYVCLRNIPDSSVGISEIKLVHASNPIARDALAVRDRSSGRMPIRYRGKALGNLALEEAYVYPPMAGPMTPADVLQTVLGLMNRRGRLQPSTVTLRDGTAIRAIPTGIRMRQPGDVQVTLLDPDTNAERAVEADEVVNIQ
jgi:hypothetical protein